MLKVITQPTIEPITLTEAKLHLRLETTADDTLVSGKLAAARQHCEDSVSRSFVTTAWRLTLDKFPFYWYPQRQSRLLEQEFPGTSLAIKLPRADVIAVTSLSYIDTAGVTQVLDPALYIVEAGAPGRVMPAYGRSWPTARTQPGGVTIDFTAGYGATADDVPAFVKAAILLLLGDLYENREDSTEARLNELPTGVCRLLAMADWGGGYA